jgi:hypothetical protein
MDSINDTTMNHLYGFKNPCFYSSLFFISNIIIAYYYSEYIYFTLFCILLSTSLILHYTQNKYMAIIDKFAVYSVILYGIYIYSSKCGECYSSYHYFCLWIVFLAFIGCIYIYFTGISYTPVNFCGVFGNWFHSIIHLLASIGHNIIIIL